jgi:hypothetical protein
MHLGRAVNIIFQRNIHFWMMCHRLLTVDTVQNGHIPQPGCFKVDACITVDVVAQSRGIHGCIAFPDGWVDGQKKYKTDLRQYAAAEGLQWAFSIKQCFNEIKGELVSALLTYLVVGVLK